ncbi:hypothetical protein [Streptococcus mitis]|uniref:hypothetical protein n=1 Tax=Streptococcus mitis TaxID=28037 RepID=UPI001D09BB58|nr:hypothetical protein [Streptococcus mitis]MBS5554235.1 hypothetical protein [Streptococcus mitis]MCB8699159.1 hypothetical protein [Streptococcus mitis]
MNDLFQHFEFTLLVYSALFSLIGSFIGFLLQVIVSTILSNRGKVKIYIKSVYNKLFSRTWGFEDSVSGMVFTVPLWIEIHNTTAKKQIIRNLNLVLYKNNSQVAKMTQMNYYEKSNQTFFYGENGAYSFLIDAYEIKRFELFFVTYKKEVSDDFDEVRISYFDSKDKYHEFKIFEISEPWIISKNKTDDDWRAIN